MSVGCDGSNSVQIVWFSIVYFILARMLAFRRKARGDKNRCPRGCPRGVPADALAGSFGVIPENSRKPFRDKPRGTFRVRSDFPL